MSGLGSAADGIVYRSSKIVVVVVVVAEISGGFEEVKVGEEEKKVTSVGDSRKGKR